jgi:hypothetical protein
MKRYSVGPEYWNKDKCPCPLLLTVLSARIGILFSIVTVSSDVDMSLFLQVVSVFPTLSLVNFVHGILYIHGQLSENLQNHRVVFGTTSEVTGSYTMESRNKLPEEGYRKDFTISTYCHKSKLKLF